LTKSIINWQTAIFEHIQEAVPNNKVFLEGVPENSDIPLDPTGFVKPFAILWFGQLTDILTGTQSGDLCGFGSGMSARTATFALEVVAPNGLSLLQFEDRIRSALTGFQPAGQGELAEGGVTAVRDPLPTGVGVGLRFYKAIFFSGVVGNTTNVAPVA
jgi:hypothetical protein